MANGILYASGNLSGSSVFKLPETATGAYAMIRNSTATLGANSSQSSPTFTVTNGDVIEAAILWVYANQGTPAGTTLVELQKGGVTQASVTVNTADLPLPGSSNMPTPVLFKFTSIATGDGGTNWTIKVTLSNISGNGITYYRNSGTAGDFTRALRTSTTTTVGAGSDIFILGELTGAGTHNSYDVTMDSTSTTQYGNGSTNSTTTAGGLIAIGNYGSLTFGSTSATNYVLRVAGDVYLSRYGTYNQGTVATPTPRDGSTVIEFVCASDGQFGFYGFDGTYISQGQSRTSGKNVTWCNLTSDVTIGTTATSVNNSNSTNDGSLLAPDGVNPVASGMKASSVSSVSHSVYIPGATLTNTTQTGTIWIAPGTGTNKRYVRVGLGNNATWSSVTNGCYVDVDLQAGTIGTATAIGNGTATSASITPCGRGYLVRLVGKVSSGSANTYWHAVSCNAPGTTTFADDQTQNFQFYNHILVTASVTSDTTLNLSADTGWLSGDAIALPSTSKTYTEMEGFVLSANAGSSSLTTALYPFYTHLGQAAPLNCEVGLLTRNNKFRSTTSSSSTFLYLSDLCSVNITWSEFYYLGANATNKRGIEIDSGAVGTAKSITYSSIHDARLTNMFLQNGTTLNLTFTNNVVCRNVGTNPLMNYNNMTTANYTMTGNLFMGGSLYGVSVPFTTTGTASFSNNVVASCQTNGIVLGTSTTYGTFSGNVVHSCGSYVLMGNRSSGEIVDLTVYHCNNYGVMSDNPTGGISYKNLKLLGNGTRQISLGGDYTRITGTSIICGTTYSASTYGIENGNVSLSVMDIDGIDFTGGGLSYATANTTNDVFFSGNYPSPQVVLNDCKFGAATPINTSVLAMPTSYVSCEKYNQTAGDHRTFTPYGTLRTDTTTVNNGAVSMKMTPSSASKKLESAIRGRGRTRRTASGSAVPVSVYVRKDSSYNGNQLRLMLRANASLGQTTDTVLATMTAGANTWQQLSATLPTANDNGAWEVYVDCDGTAGSAYVTDWAA